ncbi:MFS transporter [Lactobacillus sp. DCY120]|uniref:MFS transporter n=1 Tax=Bombilactobacillus apium TaxID=2675299 RepID=A0A850R2P1_9LACO|nr:MFS transporter [Bombilactobacillus apium]NVY97183.1 MFS transporter [Bombilactobacillus apium]
MNQETKRAIYILIVGNFLVCLGISLVIPVEPFIKKMYHLSTTDMGIMVSLYAFAQFIASPIIGRVSDKIGRKKVIVGGLFLYVISEVVFALSNHLFYFDISRIIGGLSAALFVPTSMAMASDLTEKKERARVIGWLSAAFSGGLILGPGIGGVLANFSYKTPFWVAAVLGLISAIFTAFYLPDEPVEQLKHTVKIKWREFLTPVLIVLFAMILISSFGLQGFESIYSIYVNQVFDFTMGTIALVLTLNGVLSLFFQIVAFDWITRKLGELKLIAICFLSGAIGTFWITQAHSQLEVIIATLIIFCAFDLLRPAITTLLTKTSQSNQGLINGVNMSLTSVGNIIGPIMSGMLMDWNSHVPYLVVGVILLLSFFMTLVVHRVELTTQAPQD